MSNQARNSEFEDDYDPPESINVPWNDKMGYRAMSVRRKREDPDMAEVQYAERVGRPRRSRRGIGIGTGVRRAPVHVAPSSLRMRSNRRDGSHAMDRGEQGSDGDGSENSSDPAGAMTEAKVEAQPTRVETVRVEETIPKAIKYDGNGIPIALSALKKLVPHFNDEFSTPLVQMPSRSAAPAAAGGGGGSGASGAAGGGGGGGPGAPAAAGGGVGPGAPAAAGGGVGPGAPGPAGGGGGPGPLHPAPGPGPPPAASNQIHMIYDSNLFFWLRTHPTKESRVFIVPRDMEGLQISQTSFALTAYTIDSHGIRTPVAQEPVAENDLRSRWFASRAGYNMNYAVVNRDFVCNHPSQPSYYEITRYRLNDLCLKAEELDLQFARNIQGLLGVGLAQVWACLQPDYDPSERHKIMDYFVHAKIGRYMSNVQLDDIISSAEVAHEMVRKYRVFTQEWVKQHYKYITPMITSAACQLVEKCQNVLPQFIRDIPSIVTARILWRHEKTQHMFTEALYWHLQGLEQNRGSRNPSYKQMNNVTNLHIQSYYHLVRQLSALDWKKIVSPGPFNLNFWIDVHVIDWYSICGQLPTIHHKHRGGGEGTDNLYHRNPQNRENPSTWMDWGDMRHV